MHSSPRMLIIYYCLERKDQNIFKDVDVQSSSG